MIDSNCISAGREFAEKHAGVPIAISVYRALGIAAEVGGVASLQVCSWTVIDI